MEKFPLIENRTSRENADDQDSKSFFPNYLQPPAYLHATNSWPQPPPTPTALYTLLYLLLLYHTEVAWLPSCRRHHRLHYHLPSRPPLPPPPPPPLRRRRRRQARDQGPEA